MTPTMTSTSMVRTSAVFEIGSLESRLRARNLRLSCPDRTVTPMHPYPAVGLLAASATATTGPQVTELVRINPNAHDSSWPPVLIFCVAVVVLGGLFVALVFLRRAREAARPAGRSLDG